MIDHDEHLVPGVLGKDAGKRFALRQLGPVDAATFMLRLVSALRVDSYELLLERLRASDATQKPPIDEIMQVLQGCDPDRVASLIREALASMRVAPDPQHPEAFRALTAEDIGELHTLGELLMAFIRFNFGSGV